MPLYAAIGRSYRKWNAKRLNRFLKDPKYKGEVRELIESPNPTNYDAGRFGSQLLSFLGSGYVYNMFRPHSREGFKDDSFPKLNEGLNHKEVCGKSSYFKTKGERYCLKMSSLKSNEQNRSPIMIVPGFQNAHLFHLDSVQGVSFIEYIEQNFPLKVFVLNPRGTMGGDYPHRSNIDDIAIDDIRIGVQTLASRFPQKIILMGHSQGAISAQAYLAGLDRCPSRQANKRNCFKKDISHKRQKKVSALGLLAGSVSMLSHSKKLKRIASLGISLSPWLKVFDKVQAATLTRFLLPDRRSNMATSRFWKFLYNFETNGLTVSSRIQKRLYTYSLDQSSTDIILQFARAVKSKGKGIKAKRGPYYRDHLKNIHTPVYQLTFEDDSMAYPKETLESSFKYIGSTDKAFESLDGFGHEDLFMHHDLFKFASPMMDWLTIQSL